MLAFPGRVASRKSKHVPWENTKVDGIRIGICFLLLGGAISAGAHPVIYKDGIELQGESQQRESKYSLTYSLSHRWSLGVEYYNLRDVLMSPTGSELETTVVGVNHLLKRWNNMGSQGNVYLNLGGGVLIPEGFGTEGLVSGGVQADWESTRYYVEGRYSHLRPKDASALDFKTFRAGFAPYVLSKEGINTWLIVQWTQLNQNRVQTTPLFRFYFENVLFELGHSLDGEWLFQFMIHH